MANNTRYTKTVIIRGERFLHFWTVKSPMVRVIPQFRRTWRGEMQRYCTSHLGYVSELLFYAGRQYTCTRCIASDTKANRTIRLAQSV